MSKSVNRAGKRSELLVWPQWLGDIASAGGLPGQEERAIPTPV